MNNSHPSKGIIGNLGSELAARKIVLCITGSVAAVRSAEMARLFMRHGAEVIPVMTGAARRIVHPDLMEWATGNRPVIELTGAIEHVALAGNVKGKADLIVVAPATANTIGKIACGIDDTPVTTTVTTALGEGIPLIIVPAMHEPMYNHPFVKENIRKLRTNGIAVLMPRIEEGKAKIAENHEVLEAAILYLSTGKVLSGKKVLITAGRTVEYIDPVRVITNNSTGKMGMALASRALAAGAQVTVIFGKGTVRASMGATIISVETSEQMKAAVFERLEQEHFDIVIAAAAVGDWKPAEISRQKISTHKCNSLNLKLVPTAKIIDGIKDRVPESFLVAFRAQSNMSKEDLLEDGFNRLCRARADLIAVNDVGQTGAGFETDTNELYIINAKKKVEHIPMTTKQKAAGRLIEIIAKYCSGS